MKQTAYYCKALLSALVLAPLLAACGNGNNDDFDDRVGVAAPRVRFVHVATGGPAVTLHRNENREKDATNIEYKFATQYYDVGTGFNAFSLRTASNDTEISKASLNASRGHKYTVLALLSSSLLELATIDDPYNKSLVSDNARIRFLNTAVNAQNVDVYLTAGTTDLNSVTPILSGISYKAANPPSGANSIDLEAGTYQIRVTAAGTKSPIFSSIVTLAKNVDWLLIALPEKPSSILIPNDIRVLLVRSDDTPDATDEMVTN